MAFFCADEEEIWKCRIHPTKHRTSGVCPLCLRDRLINLCPDCANVRPCACCPTSSSSSSSSSSFSLSYSTDVPRHGAGIGAIGRVSNLIESEPTFRRSRSAAFQFLRPKLVDKDSGTRLPPAGNRSKTTFWAAFKVKKGEEVKKDEKGEEGAKRMSRSKSVGFSDSGWHARLKGKGWYFPSPMKFFRQPKMAKVVQERTPFCTEVNSGS